MPSSIVSPFPFFTDASGSPLEAGYIYIGQSNLNPETAPVNVFWDLALTIPAGQPIRTVGGYPSRAGSPSRFYVSNDTYSITVRNRNHALVFSAFDQSDAPTSVFDVSTQVITATAGQTTFALTTFTYLPGTDTLQVYRNGLRLTNVTDYIETNGNTVTLTAPAAAGDQFLFQGGAVITGDQTSGTSVSFIQAGTNAVTRNIQDKAREIVSVKDFGAVGDGIANDTNAIQSAIAASGSVFIPDGIYMTDYISINKKVHITLSNGATLKNRVPQNPVATLDANWGIFRFVSGSDGSIVEGGTFDGNRVQLAPYYIGHTRLGQDNHWWAIRTEYVDDICIRDTHIKNCMNEGFYAFNGNKIKVFNVDVSDCGVAFAIQGSEPILSTGAEVNVTANNIGNIINGVAYYIFQHGIVFSNQTGFLFNVSLNGYCGSKQGVDNNSTGGGKEPVPIAANLYKLNDGFINLSVQRYTTPVGLTSKHQAINFVTVSDCSGSLDVFGFEQALACGTVNGCTFDVSFDGNYINAAGFPRPGLLLTFGGVFDVNTAGLAGETNSNLSSRNNVFSGTVQRFGIGVRDEGEANNYSSLSVIGNVTDGIQLVLPDGSSGSYPVARTRSAGSRRLIGTSITTNGGAGIIYIGGNDDVISQCYIRDNGQNFGVQTFPSNVMVFANSGEGVGLVIEGNDLDSTEGNVYTNDISYVSGTASLKPLNTVYNYGNITTLTHVYSVIARNPNFYKIGQIIKIKNALAGGQDADGKIINIQQDILTLAHSAAVVYDATLNLDNLTGTISTNGTSLIGVGTLFVSEIDFPVYLKYGSEYRNVVFVNSNTSAIISSPFSVNIPLGTVPQVVRTNSQTGIINPLYAFNVNNQVTSGPLTLRNNRHQNIPAFVDFISFDGIAAGSRFDLTYDLTMTGTSLSNVIVLGLPNYSQIEAVKAKNITAITGVTGSASFNVVRAGVTIATPIPSATFAINNINKGASPDCPSFQAGSNGELRYVSTSGNPTGTVSARITLFKAVQ